MPSEGNYTAAKIAKKNCLSLGLLDM